MSSVNRLYLTNDYSIVSKYSVIKNGYFKDKLLEELVEKTQNTSRWRRTPLINRGYAARMLAMDWIIQRSLQFESIDCCIVLGAGYDTLPFRNIDSCAWIEIDLPQVVANKCKFINEQAVLGTQGLTSIDSDIYISSQYNYSLISCDIRDADRLKNLLATILSRVDKCKRVAIINEVCLCYLDVNAIKGTIQAIIEVFKTSAHRIHYLGLEQVRPTGAGRQFSDIMLSHFHSLGYPLKHYPTKNQVRELFCDHLMFDNMTIWPLYQIYHNALVGIKQGIGAFQQEPFDEFIELDLMLSHYSIVTATLILRDVGVEKNPQYSPEDLQLSEDMENLSLQSNMSHSPGILRRFGHSSCVISGESTAFSILVTGGFGTSKKDAGDIHGRLNDCVVLQSKDAKSTPEVRILDVSSLVEVDVTLDRVFAQTQPLGGGILFCNGGRKSPTLKGALLNSFLAMVDGDRLDLLHKFEIDQSVVRWRHRLSPLLGKDQIYQIGGIKESGQSGPVVVWNLSSDSLGSIKCNSEKLDDLDRHSFGMDLRDQNTIMVIGGLQTPSALRDTPVTNNAVLWDLRAAVGPFKLDMDCSSGCYGSDIHFINEHQFLRIGGFSFAKGSICNSIDRFDLRNNKLIESQRIPNFAESPLLINCTTAHLRHQQRIISFGGGANYFTFGTQFNQTDLSYEYFRTN